jgi:hypothetical protein
MRQGLRASHSTYTQANSETDASSYAASYASSTTIFDIVRLFVSIDPVQASRRQ